MVNILSGGYFDSDRHGNQLRAEIDGKTIRIGLYDFGEMSLEKPTQIEINQVTNLLYELPSHFETDRSFGQIIEVLLSEQIDKAKSKNEPTSYLMRARKAFLALQDFQKELSKSELIAILKKIMLNDRVHPHFRKAMLASAATLASQSITDNVVGFFRRVGTQLFRIDPATPDEATQTPPAASSPSA